jgi:predicted permease
VLARFIARIRGVVLRRSATAELDEELQFHLEHEVQAKIVAGISPTEARRLALVALGGLPQVREAVHDVRAMRLESLWRDVRFAFSSFRSARLFCVGIICTLAIGIGANGAVFSVLHAVLLQPLPYRAPNELSMLWWRYETAATGQLATLRGSNERRILTAGMVQGLRDHAKDIFADVAALTTWETNPESQFDLALSDRAERLRGAFATPNFFDVLGVQASAGRVFSSTDEAAGTPTLVISDGLWRRAFAADPTIIGRPVSLLVGRSPRASRIFVVVGVLPRGFRFTYPQETEAWAVLPWSEVQRSTPAGLSLRAVARTRLKVTFATAQSRLGVLQAGLPNRPNTPAIDRVAYRLEPVTDWILSESRPSLLLLGGVAIALLLITCATVANALFVRVALRQRELAVRAALGAGRTRLVQQLLIESLALVLVGTVAGTLLAIGLMPVLRAVVPTSMPRGDEIGLRPWILTFGATTAAVTTLLAGLAPAWRGARLDMMATLKRAATAASADPTTARWRQTCLGIQVGVATALLVSAGLLLASFWRLGHVPLGFDADGVLTVEMRLLDAKYHPPPAASDRASWPTAPIPLFQNEVLARVRALPGVLDAGLTSAVPFRGVDFLYFLKRVGDTRRVVGNARFVDPAYFSVMRIPIVRGRVFAETDTASSPRVVVLSESYARNMFRNEDPLGQTIALDEGPAVVLGVVGDVRYVSRDKAAEPAIYIPRAQTPVELICLVVRTAPNAGPLGPAIRGVIHDIDPALPVINLTTVDRIVAESTSDRRFYTAATTTFASVALLLTITGLVVVVARAIVERRRELAIRAALGARPSNLIRRTVEQALMPVVIGAGVGLAAAYAGATLLGHFLFRISPHEPRVYIIVGLLVVIIGFVAALLPARRILQIAPATVLRAE